MKLFLYSLIIGSTLLQACKPGERGVSGVNHKSGSPTRSMETYNWVNVPSNFFSNPDAIAKLGATATPVSGRSWFPSLGRGGTDIGFTKDIFAKLVAYYKTKLNGAVPEPQLVIYDNQVMNAITVLSSNCISKPLIPGYQATKVSESARGITLDGTGIHLSANPAPLGCKDESDTVLERLISQFNNANGVSCKLALTKGAITYSSECARQGAYRSNVTQFQAVAPLILVSTGYLKSVSKDGVAFTLAHELAHFYHADGSAFLPELSYLYDEKANTADGEPKAIPDGHPLSKMYSEVRKQLGNIETVKRYQGQRLHPRAINFMRNQRSNNICSLNNTACNNAMKPYDALIDSYDRVIRNADYPMFEPLEDAATFKQAVLALDTKGLEILKGLSTSLFLTAQGDDSSRWIKVEPFTAEWNSSKTFGEFIEKTSQAYDAQEQKSVSFWNNLASSGLGWYTFEQRADDMGFEAARAVGAKPECIIQSFISLFPMSTAHNGAFEKEKCIQAINSGFAGMQSMPVGNWEDVHHSLCYRAYNLTKELSRHPASSCQL